MIQGVAWIARPMAVILLIVTTGLIVWPRAQHALRSTLMEPQMDHTSVWSASTAASGSQKNISLAPSQKADPHAPERAAVLFLGRPKDVNSKLRGVVDTLFRSCQFLKGKKAYILIAGDDPTSPPLVPKDALGPNAEIIDVTQVFWRRRPAPPGDLMLSDPTVASGLAGPTASVFPKWAKKTFHVGYRAMCDFCKRPFV